MDFYSTSKTGFKQIIESGVPNDFIFIIFDDEIYCPKSIASFISPIISKHIRNDITFCNYKIVFPPKSRFYSNHNELKNIITNTNFVNLFNNFLQGHPIHLNLATSNKNENGIDFYLVQLTIELGIALANYDMVYEGCKSLGLCKEINKMTNDDIMKIIKINRDAKNYQSNDKFFNHISSHFYAFCNTENLKELNKDELEAIISSPELKIESEDSLFEFITSLGSEFTYLYDYLNVEFLSQENINILVKNINQYDLTIHKKLWLSISNRLTLDPSQLNNLENNPRIKQAEINCNNTGVFEYLRKLSNGNPYETKAFSIESTPHQCGDHSKLFDKSKDTFIRLTQNPENFILFDFMDKKISISKYSLSVPSSYSTHSLGQPKCWKIQGSNDKESWDDIDSIKNNYDLNGYGKEKTFDVKNKSKKFYRYIWIYKIVNHSSGSHENVLLLSDIEFYGSVREIF